MRDDDPTTEAAKGGETLPALLGGLSRERGAAPAIVYGGEGVSFAELEERSRRVAQGLLELGVGPGDRVALWLPNAPAWFALLFACARLGAIAVAVNTRFRSAEVGDIVGRSGAKLLVLWPGFRRIDFTGILRDIDPAALTSLAAIVVYDEGGDAVPDTLLGRRAVPYRRLEGRPPCDLDRASGESGCLIFTTSGTTRAPKFVLHKQAAVVRHARDVARRFGYAEPGTRLLQALPFCGTFGLAQAAAALAAGSPSVLMPAFDATEAAELIRLWAITHLNGTDDMFDRLLAAAPEARPFPTLRWCGYAAFTPSLADLVERADHRGVRLVGLYGASECQALFAGQPVEADAATRARPGGFPVSEEAAVRIRDPETGEVLPDGRSGEIELRGPSIMVGYFGDARATAAAFTEDGFVRTGDLGYATPGGGFVLLSRMGDVLRLGGFLVSPTEIEGHILENPGIEGCQVVGVATASGTRPVAFVILAAGAEFSEERLRDHCRKGLARYKVPERFFVLQEFPTTVGPNGIKVQRGRLQEMAASRLSETAAAP
jgi:fatty-acyl-CoA synthase